MDLTEQKFMLNQFRLLIEISQTRGVWMANEMEKIGSTYNKVESFLTKIDKEEERLKKTNQIEKPKDKHKDIKKLRIVTRKEDPPIV